LIWRSVPTQPAHTHKFRFSRQSITAENIAIESVGVTDATDQICGGTAKDNVTTVGALLRKRGTNISRIDAIGTQAYGSNRKHRAALKRLHSNGSISTIPATKFVLQHGMHLDLGSCDKKVSGTFCAKHPKCKFSQKVRETYLSLVA